MISWKTSRSKTAAILLLLPMLASGASAGAEAGSCNAAPEPWKPLDPEFCATRLAEIQNPRRSLDAMGLAAFEALVGEWMANLCYRADGWIPDGNVRDTGPLPGKQTHAAVRIWYSPEMARWVARHRDGESAQSPPSAPEGGILVKEMWPQPAGQYAGCCLDCMQPFGGDGSGVTFMIRDAEGFASQWFFGYWGAGSRPDWPPDPFAPAPLTAMGGGGPQYCSNCHASAVDNNTFVDYKNISYEYPPITFEIQGDPAADPEATPAPAHPITVVLEADPDSHRLGEPYDRYFEVLTSSGNRRSFAELMHVERSGFPAPDWQSVDRMPPQIYDNVLVPAHNPHRDGGLGLDEFVTSSQCLGCHQAGATGITKDMYEVNPHRGADSPQEFVDVSPFTTWRTSPMGLAGRDPIFFSQLESEIALHRARPEPVEDELAGFIEDLCLHCHGIMGERQFEIDTFDPETGECRSFRRRMADAVPYPPGNPTAGIAKYGSLARDGIACATCHHAVAEGVRFDGKSQEGLIDPEESLCIVRHRDKYINPGFRGFARSFSGFFQVGEPEIIYGPYADPRRKPMQNTLGITPEAGATISSPEVCGTCHAIHLPVVKNDPAPAGSLDQWFAENVIKRTYEQTTYGEWIMSDYRTASQFGDYQLPAGSRAKTCQDCHMPDRVDSASQDPGEPFRSKIAVIEEYTPFPQASFRSPPSEIDLAERQPYSHHTLVGLNVFFIKMAQQFPNVLGLAGITAGFGGVSVPGLLATEQAMVDQAFDATAELSVTGSAWNEPTFSAEVKIENLVGHSFPSGVSFRRAFLEFSVLDAWDNVLWASGRTDAMGAIVDEDGEPIAGEFWWSDDCGEKTRVPAEVPPAAGLPFQPHYQTITAQDQAQIYQEMEADPDGYLTTSFLSIYRKLKDNRLEPHGLLPLGTLADECGQPFREPPPDGELTRVRIARILGDTTTPVDPEEHPDCDESLAVSVGPGPVARKDPDYDGSGFDTLTYEATLAPGQRPSRVQVKLEYQATPPFFLQDRFCTSRGEDTQRLYFLAGHLNLEGSEAESWALEVASVCCDLDGAGRAQNCGRCES